MSSSTHSSAPSGTRETLHLFHHTFCRGGGMESYAMSLAGTLVQLGHRVVFHAHKTDAALAEALGVELRISHVSRFPRKLQDFRFFRQVDRAGTQAEGLQIALARDRKSTRLNSSHLGIS